MSRRTPAAPRRIVVTEANQIDPELAVETLRELWQARQMRLAANESPSPAEAAPTERAAA